MSIVMPKPACCGGCDTSFCRGGGDAPAPATACTQREQLPCERRDARCAPNSPPNTGARRAANVTASVECSKQLSDGPTVAVRHTGALWRLEPRQRTPGQRRRLERHAATTATASATPSRCSSCVPSLAQVSRAALAHVHRRHGPKCCSRPRAKGARARCWRSARRQPRPLLRRGHGARCRLRHHQQRAAPTAVFGCRRLHPLRPRPGREKVVRKARCRQHRRWSRPSRRWAGASTRVKPRRPCGCWPGRRPRAL